MALTEPQRAAYQYLRGRATDGATFTRSNLEAVAGWSKGTFETYKTKHLKDYITTAGKGRFGIDARFLRLSEDQFAEIVTQSRKTVAKFRRAVVHSLLRYEFLLPLTNERRLRAALDELFYREPLEQRAREIGKAQLEPLVPSLPGEPDAVFFARVAERVGGLLGGYSIGHVDGRFRAGGLKTYQDAAALLAARGRYLVDETTAVVRFIMPIAESRLDSGPVFGVAGPTTMTDDVLRVTLAVARGLFIAFFVESVIFDIHGEDEIWFLEASPEGERLYVLERDPGAPSKTVPPVPSAGKNEGGNATPIVQWLKASGYDDVAAKIEKIEMAWRRNKVKTRRNWFEILGGDARGRPREVAGQTFPVIASIRHRQGLDPIIGAEHRAHEQALPFPR